MSDPTPPVVLLWACSELSRPLRDSGMRPHSVRSLRQLRQPKDAEHPRAIVIGASVWREHAPTDAIPKLREAWPMVDIVIWAPRATASIVRDSLQAGAKDVLLGKSPVQCAHDVVKIIEAQQLLPRSTIETKGPRHEFNGMFARSRKMWDLFDTATQIAPTKATVLILGETGTGKELLARAIHRLSGLSGRFVPINCGAVNENLIDSELFGHTKGAFTGATQTKTGLFQHAQNGSLFLDEIGNIPLSAQYHLLRALQEGAIRPVGGQDEIPIDVRIIAATSNALDGDVRDGHFREDLFYRLDVIRLTIPPLRERPEDIVFLFGMFARTIAEDYNVSRPDLREDFLDALVSYSWPGNVRQLENFTERLVLTCTGQRVDAGAFERLVSHAGPANRSLGRSRSIQEKTVSVIDKTLDETVQPQVDRLEREYLETALRQTRGRIQVTAELAGIGRRTLLRKLKRHNLSKELYK